MVGTSRNLDRQLVVNRASGTAAIKQDYRALLQNGADLVETDLPTQVGKLLYDKSAIPASKSQFFRMSSSKRVPWDAGHGALQEED